MHVFQLFVCSLRTRIASGLCICYCTGKIFTILQSLQFCNLKRKLGKLSPMRSNFSVIIWEYELLFIPNSLEDLFRNCHGSIGKP